MVDTYTIYLVNESADTQTFWCFLQPPEQLVSDPSVFANSNASLAIDPNSPASNYFAIPAQFIVGAGASNNAVGLGVEIVSSVTANANLSDTWDASYATVPPRKGPTLSNSGVIAPANSIALVSNDFNKVTNGNHHWFSNQSFGIETDSGFIGMSWSPDPQQTRTLTPKLKFFVATGDFDSNALASWTDVSNHAAEISAPGDFKYNNCTVTYTQTGSWNVTPGQPTAQELAKNLAWFRSDAHAELAALAYLGSGAIQDDRVVGVHWDSNLAATEGDGTFLTGTLTVQTALVAAFTYFVLAGVYFRVDRSSEGGTKVHFSYSGDWGVKAVQALFTYGAQLFFGGAK